MTATIIPFPASRPADTGAGDDRLRRALAALDAALTAQRAAVADWRQSLAQLGETMQGLGASLHRYRGNLLRVEVQVGGLNKQAVALEAWADKALAGQQG